MQRTQNHDRHPHHASRGPGKEPRRVLASISRSGRIAAFRRPGAVELCVTRSGRRILIDAPSPTDFGFGAGGLWVLGGGYVHWMTEEGRSQLDCLVGDGIEALQASRSTLPSCVLKGRRIELCELYDSQLFAFPLVLGTRGGESVFPVGPRLLAVSTDEALRIVHLEEGNLFSHAAPERSAVRAVSPVFGGTAVAVVFAGTEPAIWLLTPSGDPIYQLPIGRPDLVAIAEDRGIVIIATGNVLCSVDLRHGGVREWAETPFPIDDIDICARARGIVVAQKHEDRPRTWFVRYSDIFRDKV